MQLPAVFIVDGGIVRYAYYGKNVGDLPDMEELKKKAMNIQS